MIDIRHGERFRAELCSADMRALRLVLAAAALAGCRDAGSEGDGRVQGHAQRASSAVAAREDAGLVFIPQTGPSDCGPAAIATTLSHYGRPATLDESKAAMHFHSEPASALDLVNAAEASGLAAVGIRVDAEGALPVLRTGDILHFDGNHFVVFEALAADGVRLMDPAAGRRVVDRTTFAQHFSGMALLFERSPAALEARKRAMAIAPAR